MESSLPKLLTKREAGDLLTVSERTIHTLIKTGKLAAVRIGESVRIDVRDAVAYVEAQRGARAAAIG